MDFQEIFEQYRPRVFRYLARLVGEDDATDLTQVVFLKICRGLNDLRAEDALTTWIYRIASNTARDHLTSKPTGTVALAEDENRIEEELPDPQSFQAEEEFIRREMSECIRGMINSLPTNYRDVLLLSEIESFSNAEIAIVLDITVDNVKIRLHRARAALRKTMEGGCTFYHDGRSELMCDRKV